MCNLFGPQFSLSLIVPPPPRGPGVFWWFPPSDTGAELFAIQPGTTEIIGQPWGSLDDVVMGGVSASGFRREASVVWALGGQRRPTY